MTPVTSQARPKIGGRFRTEALISVLGTAGAQVVNIAAIPFLSRLYTPSQFGIWAIYLAVLSIFQSLVMLRFDIAIVTARTERLAGHMMLLTILMSIGSAAVLGVLLAAATLLFGGYHWFGAQLPWAVWAPVGIMGTSIYNLGLSWWMRGRAYRSITAVRVGLPLASVILQLLMFKFGLEYGLVVGNGLGQILVTIAVCAMILPMLTMPGSARSFVLRSLAAVKRFRRLALYTTPYTLQSQFFRQIVVVLLSALGSAQVAGLYAVSLRFVSNPLVVVADAIQQPIYPRLAASPNDPAVHNLIAAILKRLAVGLGVGCAVATVFARPLLILVLGSKWEAGAPYIVATSYATASLVATSWLCRIFDIFERQKLHLIIDVTGNLIMVGSFVAVLLTWHDSVKAVIALSSATAIYYAVWAVLAFRVANIKQKILINTLQIACAVWAAAMVLCLTISYATGIGLMGPGH